MLALIKQIDHSIAGWVIRDNLDDIIEWISSVGDEDAAKIKLVFKLQVLAKLEQPIIIERFLLGRRNVCFTLINDTSFPLQ